MPETQNLPIPKAAFTLVEILVTVAIIAILASIAIPAVRDASRKRDRTLCLSNLKNLHQAMHAYILQDPLDPQLETNLKDATFLRNFAGADVEMLRCPLAPDGDLGYKVNANIHNTGTLKDRGEIAGANIFIYEVVSDGGSTTAYRHNGYTNAITYYGDIQVYQSPGPDLTYIPRP